MTLTLADYGIGNLRSLEKALVHIGATVHRTSDPDAVARAEKLVVPGVGAFGACADALRAHGFEAPICEAVDRGVPLLGVCVGMQLLFDGSDEMGDHAGLGLLPGRVVRFAPAEIVEDNPEGEREANGTGALVARRLKIPHVGWTPLFAERDSPILDGVGAGAHVYFVHSYHAAPAEPRDVIASADYGGRFPAIVGRNRVFGVQFHPEKSQGTGLRILRNFAHLSV